MPVKAIGIQCYGPSGSLFLHSLLDGHPSLMSLPGVLSAGFYIFWERHGRLPQDCMIDALVEFFSELFIPGDSFRECGLMTLGPNRDETTSIDRDKYRASLFSFLCNGDIFRRDVLMAMFRAYRVCLGLDGQIADTVIIAVHGQPLRYVSMMLEDFPDMKFIYMVRDPIQTFASIERRINEERLPVNTTECAASSILCDFTKQWGGLGHWCCGSKPYREDMRNFCRAVRLEDLHLKPRETLESICRWIDIPWNDCLLESTFGGKKWWNLPQSPKLSGFGNDTIKERHRDYLNRFDVFRVRCLTRIKSHIWGYEVPPSVDHIVSRILLPFLLWLPFRSEWALAWSRVVNATKGIPEQGGRFVQRVGIGRYLLADVFPWLPWLYDRSKPLFSVVIWALCPLLIVRDYLAVRFWLFLGLVEQLRPNHREVLLLTLEPIGGNDKGEPTK